MRTLARGLVVATLGLGCLAAADYARAEGRGARKLEIRMRGNSFAPRSVTASVGDTIEWVNTDIVRHNAVRDDLFDSGDLRRGERFAWVPEDTGTFRYQCTIHSRMRGTLRVKAVDSR